MPTVYMSTNMYNHIDMCIFNYIGLAYRISLPLDACLDLGITKMFLISSSSGICRPSKGRPSGSKMRPRRAVLHLVAMNFSSTRRASSPGSASPANSWRIAMSSFQARRTASAPPQVAVYGRL